jgi:hydroxymethylbilane synthase
VTVRLGHFRDAVGEAQAGAVARELARVLPGTDVSLVPVEPDSEPEAVAKGVLASGLELALMNEEADLAAGSLQNIGVLIPEGLKLAAVTQRIDARDAVLTRTRQPLRAMPARTEVLVDCPRRAAQLRKLRYDLVPVVRALRTENLVEAVLETEGAPAGVCALSDLRWMGREPDAAEILAVKEMLPGPGQGAVGLEIRDGDSSAEKAALALHHRRTWSCARAEREVIAGLGWSAYVPLAAFAEIEGDDTLRLRAAVFGPAGEYLASAEICDSPQRATTCARTVIEDLKGAGAEQVLRSS